MKRGLINSPFLFCIIYLYGTLNANEDVFKNVLYLNEIIYGNILSGVWKHIEK